MKTVVIDVLVISRNCDRNNHAMYQYNEQTYLENKKKEPVEPVQMNIQRRNTYRKDLSWLILKDEPRVQERQQAKDQKCCISAFVAYLTIPSGNQKHKHSMTTVFYADAQSYGRFIEIQGNRATSRERNFIERITSPIFLETFLAIENM